MRKLCDNCKKKRDLKFFGLCNRAKDKKQNICKTCKKTLNKDYRNKNKDYFKEYWKEYYKRNREKEISRVLEWRKITNQ